MELSLHEMQLPKSMGDKASEQRIWHAYQMALEEHFQVGFDVGGVRTARKIVWNFGPSESDVWKFIFEQVSDLAEEALSVGWETKEVCVIKKTVDFRFPDWLHREDFLSSLPSYFPYLLSVGGDPNAIDEVFRYTPLEFAIMARKDIRAVELLKIGARYLPETLDEEVKANIPRMPAFLAYLEALQLDQITPHPPKKGSRQARL
jgi:hypothetical protein